MEPSREEGYPRHTSSPAQSEALAAFCCLHHLTWGSTPRQLHCYLGRAEGTLRVLGVAGLGCVGKLW